MANVIEILLKGTDDTAGLRRGIKELKVAFAALGVKALFDSLIRNISEAENAAAQLDQAFKNTGATLGKSRQELDDLAVSMQKTTIYSDDLVKQGEAILLTFDKVRGDAFGRTVQVAGDLAARLGGDLTSSIQQLGRALNDPVQGLKLLRRAGIQFSDSQEDLVKSLVKTGDQAKAQDFILAELERRYGGSAAAARNTLGGALVGLKNSFGDLFEGTKEGTSAATNAINSLSEALANPEIKKGIDAYITGLAKIAEITVSLVSVIGRLGSKIKEVLSGDGVLGQTMSGLFNMLPGSGAIKGALALATTPKQEPFKYQYDTSSRFPWERSGGAPFISNKPQLEEVNIMLQSLKDDYKDILKDMEDSTKTSTEKQAADFIKLKTNLQFLRDYGLISPEKYSSRLEDAQKELLPEFDLNEIKAMYVSVKKETTEVSEFVKGVWQGTGESIRSTLSDAFYEGELSVKSFVDVVRRAIADILSALVTSKLKDFFLGASKNGNSTAGFLTTIATFFGFSAGGGKSTRPRWVGEEGPELVIPGKDGMSVYNQRQLSGMGGGGLVYSPTNVFNIIEREDPKTTRRELIEYYEARSAQQQSEFVRLLGRSGVEVRG